MEKNAGKYLSISFAVLTCIALILSLKISLVYIRAESYYGNETYFENGFHFLKRDIITLANELFYDVGASSIKKSFVCYVWFSAQSELFFLCRDCCVPSRTPSCFCTIAVSVALVFSLIYTILGIVYAEAVEVIISEEELSVSVSTYSYFSFVAVLVAGVLLFRDGSLISRRLRKTDKVAKSSQSQILEEKELKTVEVLLRYKELFDRGVITEQEYENKKERCWRKQRKQLEEKAPIKYRSFSKIPDRAKA